MAMNSLTEFLESVEGRLYRKLVEHHIRKQSTDQIASSLRDEVELLPSHLRGKIETFIDVVNAGVGHDRSFWAKATCQDAAVAISEAAMRVMSPSDIYRAVEPIGQEWWGDNSLGIFQIATLNFAHSASFQRRQRKFMGIRKGLFR